MPAALLPDSHEFWMPAQSPVAEIVTGHRPQVWQKLQQGSLAGRPERTTTVGCLTRLMWLMSNAWDVRPALVVNTSFSSVREE